MWLFPARGLAAVEHHRTFPAFQRKGVFCICSHLHIHIAGNLVNVIITIKLSHICSQPCVFSVSIDSFRDTFIKTCFWTELQTSLVFNIHSVAHLDSVSFLLCQDAVCVLEVVLTTGRWLHFDNGGLGNRRYLTQDAELPLSFFCAPSPFCLPFIPAFLPSSWQFSWTWSEMGLRYHRCIYGEQVSHLFLSHRGGLW